MKPTVVVLGSGPIRIGQGIEFDYSCVHCVWALQELGYRAVIVNNNPETVSTDFDTADALYFEPVTLHDVAAVVRHERAEGVVVQFGGQTAINLAQPLEQAGIRVLGTSPRSIAMAEDRGQFDRILADLGVRRPPGAAVNSLDDGLRAADRIGYPVLVRPSFVLGGRAMEIVRDSSSFAEFYREAESASPGQPVLVDSYLAGTEAEIDVVSDGEDTLVPGLMEHIERAGVHSGDSMAVYPPIGLNPEVQWEMVETGRLIARELKVKGLMNIQFAVVDGQVYVIEVNPRASRTVPYLSKVTGVPMVQLATRAMVGRSLAQEGYGSGLWARHEGQSRVIGRQEFLALGEPISPVYAVKAPVFSFQKLGKVDPALGPEMKSTGEVLGIDRTFEGALYKALVASGVTFRSRGQVILTVAEGDKAHAVGIGKLLVDQGYSIGATQGTHDVLSRSGIPSEPLKKIQEGSPNLLDRLMAGQVSLMVNTPGPAGQETEHAQRIRRACIETGVACVTNIDTATALVRALTLYASPLEASCMTLGEYLATPQKVN